MPNDTAYSEQEQQQAPARASASEQPEALVQSKSKAKQFMNESLRSIQLQGLSPIDARLQVAGELPIDSFQCQLWEPARAVQELQPGTFLTSDACCSQLLLQRDGFLVVCVIYMHAALYAACAYSEQDQCALQRLDCCCSLISTQS